MGLFQDTIRDAHRPLGGTVLRRSIDAQVDAPTEEQEPIAEEPADGMQTIFRFQKEGATAFAQRPPQASSRPEVGSSRSSVGDPLSASAEVESPRRIAPSDRVTPIPTMFDRSNGDLETGQQERVGPSEAEAAHASSAKSTMYQPVDPPVHDDAVSFRHVLDSEVTSGSEPNARRSDDSFESRVSGRDAPSESSLPALPVTAPITPLTAPVTPTPAAHYSEARPTGRAPDVQAASPATQERAGPATATSDATQPRPAPASHHAGARSVSARPRTSADPLADGAPLNRTEPAPESSLVIGRIDVVVTATNTTASPVANSGGSDRGFLSRNYLKRL